MLSNKPSDQPMTLWIKQQKLPNPDDWIEDDWYTLLLFGSFQIKQQVARHNGNLR